MERLERLSIEPALLVQRFGKSFGRQQISCDHDLSPQEHDAEVQGISL